MLLVVLVRGGEFLIKRLQQNIGFVRPQPRPHLIAYSSSLLYFRLQMKRGSQTLEKDRTRTIPSAIIESISIPF